MPTRRPTTPTVPRRTETTTCAIYVRISSDREGARLGVEQQRDETARLAAQLGLEVYEVYEDNDKSASKGKTRPNFERMLAEGAAGRFDTIIASTSSRLTREDLTEQERMITYSRANGIKLAYVSSPTVDLNTADGRRTARFMHVVNRGEVETLGERVHKRAVQRAQLGMFHGGPVPFGYRGTRVVVNPESDKPKVRTSIEVDPAARDMLRDAARRVLAGESLYSIGQEWNEAGHRTRRDNKWTGGSVKAVLLTPSVVGLRLVDGDPTEYAAPWPAILDRDTWDELYEVLSTNTPFRTPGDGSFEGTRPLVGIVHCHCGGKMTAHMSHGELRLACVGRDGCMKTAIKHDPLFDLIWWSVMRRLEAPEFQAQLAERSTTTDRQRKALREELKVLDGRRRRLAESFELGLRTRQEAKVQGDVIDREMTRVRDEMAALTRTHATAGVENAADAEAMFKVADVTRQRAFLSGLIADVVIAPHPVGVCRTLPRRKGDTDESLRARRAEHDEEVLLQRVSVRWH